MKRELLLSCILNLLKSIGIISVFLNSSVFAATPNHPFPQHLNYPDSIRPNQFTQTEQDGHVQTFYDYWKQNYLVSAGTDSNGNPLYRIAFSKGSDTTVSEGQGFGMMIVVLMAGYEPEAQNLFDGLWRFVRQYPSTIDSRLMAWKVQNGTAVPDANSAFDGDADIAYSLLLAAAQWGNPGEIDYQAEATTMIAGILESTIGPQSRLPLLGDWTQPEGSTYNQYTPRSSDFMLANFQAFAQATGDSTWQTVIDNSHSVAGYIQQQYSPDTGLLPDFIQCQSVTQCEPAQAPFLEGENDGNYYYNAGRVPWRLGLHALLHNDAASRSQMQKITDWLVDATGGDAGAIKSGYQLNGTPIGNYFSSFFAAPFGVAAMLSPSQQDFLNAIYQQVYQRQENYYEDSVNLLCLLAMTGNAWTLKKSTSRFLPAIPLLLLKTPY
ncbi:MAG: beta-glucanase [Candidatus Electrothrix sp. ATG1]|nr:beta-glucanase [Candidatus Electrothrix sp. ATG1]